MKKLLIDLENVLVNGNGHSDVYLNNPVHDARDALASWTKKYSVVVISGDVSKGSEWLRHHDLPHSFVVDRNIKSYDGNVLIDSSVDSLSRFNSGVPICFAKPENKHYGGAKVGSLKEAEFAVRVLDAYRS